MKTLYFFLILTLSISNAVLADFVLDIQPVGTQTVASGGSLTYDVKLAMTSGSASFDLQTFSLYFDLHQVGASNSSEFPFGIGTITVSNYLSDFAATGTNPSFQLANDIRALGLQPTFDFEVDAQKNNGTTTVPTSPTNLTLFRLTIQSGSAAAGNYEIAFVSDPSYFDPSNSTTTSLGTPPITGTGDAGNFSTSQSLFATQFSITSVPEPSSGFLILCSTPLVALILRIPCKWRARNSQKASLPKR